jgi:hypothetical protein
MIKKILVSAKMAVKNERCDVTDSTRARASCSLRIGQVLLLQISENGKIHLFSF